eukprot:UN02145
MIHHNNNINNLSMVQPGTSHQTAHPVGSTTYTVRSLFPNSALNSARKLGLSYASNNGNTNINTITPASSQLSTSQIPQHSLRNNNNTTTTTTHNAAPSINTSHKQHVGVYSPDQIIDFQIGTGTSHHGGGSNIDGNQSILSSSGTGGGGGNIPTSSCIVDPPEVAAQVNDLFNQLLAKKTTQPSYRQQQYSQYQQQQHDDENNNGLNISATHSSHRNSPQVQYHRTGNSFKTNNPFTNSNTSSNNSNNNNNNGMGDELTPSSSYMELTQYSDNNKQSNNNHQHQQQQSNNNNNNNINASGLGQMLRQHTSIPEQTHPQFVKSTDVRR